MGTEEVVRPRVLPRSLGDDPACEVEDLEPVVPGGVDEEAHQTHHQHGAKAGYEYVGRNGEDGARLFTTTRARAHGVTRLEVETSLNS